MGRCIFFPAESCINAITAHTRDESDLTLRGFICTCHHCAHSVIHYGNNIQIKFLHIEILKWAVPSFDVPIHTVDIHKGHQFKDRMDEGHITQLWSFCSQITTECWPTLELPQILACMYNSDEPNQTSNLMRPFQNVLLKCTHISSFDGLSQHIHDIISFTVCGFEPFRPAHQTSLRKEERMSNTSI